MVKQVGLRCMRWDTLGVGQRPEATPLLLRRLLELQQLCIVAVAAIDPRAAAADHLGIDVLPSDEDPTNRSPVPVRLADRDADPTPESEFR